MKQKLYAIVILVTFFITLVSFGMAAAAGPQLIEASITDVVQGTDKNGSPYTRIIVAEEGKIQGHSFTYGVPVMCFGELAGPGLTYSPGQVLKAVVTQRDYNGSKSYTVVSFIAD